MGTVKIETEQYKNNECEEITFPISLIEIGDRAFENCDLVERIKLPNRMKSIGERAFTGCTRLKEVYLPYSVVKIGDAAFQNCRIIYCEMMNPPEYWYNEKEEEWESEDYAMYVYADYNQWCGDWGIYAYNESDDVCGEDYIKHVLYKNPELHVMWGRDERFMSLSEKFLRFDIFAWMSEVGKYHYMDGTISEKLGFSQPVVYLRAHIISSLEIFIAYPNEEQKHYVENAFQFYNDLFCEIWNLPGHEEEYLFYCWEIYRYALDMQKEIGDIPEPIKQWLNMECEKRKQKLISFCSEWEKIL